jgi:hypothetical protein
VVFERLVFRVHAIQRMYQRSISEEEVRIVIRRERPLKIIQPISLTRVGWSLGGTVFDPFMLWWLTI